MTVWSFLLWATGLTAAQLLMVGAPLAVFMSIAPDLGWTDRTTMVERLLNIGSSLFALALLYRFRAALFAIPLDLRSPPWLDIVLALVAGVLTSAATRFEGVPDAEDLRWYRDTLADFAPVMIPLYLISACLLTPLIEEILYRWVGFMGLRASYGALPAFAVSTLVFYVHHLPRPDDLTHALVLVTGSAIACLLLLAGRSIWTCVALHAGFNLPQVLLAA